MKKLLFILIILAIGSSMVFATELTKTKMQAWNGITWVDVTADANSQLITNSEIAGYNGTNWWPIKMDAETRALICISYEHHEVHSGSHYFVRDFVDLGNNGVQDLVIVTPDNARWCHLLYTIEHELEGSVQFYEGATVTQEGVAEAVFNNNRNSTNTSEVTVHENSTIEALGTLLAQDHKGSGKKFGGSGDRGAEEIILKQNTKYLLRMTNQTANNNLFNWELSFYLHTNKDT